MCVCTQVLLDRKLGVCVSLWGRVNDPGSWAAGCLPAWCVCNGRTPTPPQALFLGAAATGPGSRPPLPLAQIQQGSRFPPPAPPPAPPTSPHTPPPPGGSGNGGSAPPRPAGPQSRAFPPRRLRGAAAVAPLRPLLPPFLLPSFPPSLPRAECGRGWEEISPEFPFHTSRLNFLSVSRPLAVCSFSCHRKCQAKVSGRGPAGSAGGARGRDWLGSGTGAGGAGGPGAVPGSSPCPALCLCKASGREQARVKVKARPRVGGRRAGSEQLLKVPGRDQAPREGT